MFFELLFNRRKRSECAKWYIPLTSQSELSLQHHPGIPGFSSQLWHRESHGFKRHYQDPQPSLQRVSVSTCPTRENQECWYGWTMLEPPALDTPVLLPIDRVAFVSRPVECSTDAEHIVLSLPKCMPVITEHALSSCSLSCGPIVPAHPCLTDAFKASKDFSDQAPPQLWTPAHSSLRPLHVKLPIVVSPNHKAARGKYDGLIRMG